MSLGEKEATSGCRRRRCGEGGVAVAAVRAGFMDDLAGSMSDFQDMDTQSIYSEEPAHVRSPGPRSFSASSLGRPPSSSRRPRSTRSSRPASALGGVAEMLPDEHALGSMDAGLSGWFCQTGSRAAVTAFGEAMPPALMSPRHRAGDDAASSSGSKLPRLRVTDENAPGASNRHVMQPAGRLP